MKAAAFSLILVLVAGAICLPVVALRGDAEASTAPDEDRGEVLDVSPNYRLRPLDLIRVTVLREPELSTQVRLDANGEVDLPLVGAVKVVDLTRTEAQRRVEAAYIEERFLRRPQVTIFIEEYSPREISILGQVRSPGKYPLPVETNLTVVEAITRAGGLTDVAKGSDVRLTRVGKDGEEVAHRFNVDAALRGRSRDGEAEKLMVQPGDVIFVPESLF